ncbi:MAG: hypothetical protein R3E66_01095 [bacterium]
MRFEYSKVRAVLAAIVVVWAVACGDDAKPDTPIETPPSPTCANVTCGSIAICVEVEGVPTCRCLARALPGSGACVEPLALTNLPAEESGRLSNEDSYVLAISPESPAARFGLAATDCAFDVDVSPQGLVSWTCGDVPSECSVNVFVSDIGSSTSGVLSISCQPGAPDFVNRPSGIAEQGVVYRFDAACDADLESQVVVTPQDTCGGELDAGIYTFTPARDVPTCTVALACVAAEKTTTITREVAIRAMTEPPVFANLPATATAIWGRTGEFVLAASDADSQDLEFALAQTTCDFPVSVTPQGAVDWRCGEGIGTCSATVRVTDGFSTTEGSLNIACTNSFPTVSVPQIQPRPILWLGQALTCNYTFIDSDGDEDLSRVEWLVNGVVRSNRETFTAYDEDDFVRCRITPNDGLTDGIARVSNEITAPLRLLVAAGEKHTCVRPRTGNLRCWGDNTFGQAGDGGTAGASTPSGLQGGITDVGAGRASTCVVRQGDVLCFGDGQFGVLGPTVLTQRATPTLVLTGGVTDLAVGNDHVCAVQNGAVLCWGNNTWGQLGGSTGYGVAGRQDVPTVVPGLEAGVDAVVAGAEHTCALQNGAVKCFGRNTFDSLGRVAANDFDAEVVPGLVSPTDLTAGAYHTCVIDGGQPKCWGDNTSRQLGNGFDAPTLATPTAVTAIQGAFDWMVAVGRNTCVKQVTGLKCWGDDEAGLLLGGGTSAAATTVLMPVVSGFGGGVGHMCGERTGELYCWGDNTDGQLLDVATTGQTGVGPVRALY